MSPFWKNFITSFLSAFNQTRNSKSKTNHSDLNVGLAVDTDSSANNDGFSSDQITQISPAGIELISSFEGLKLEAYYDSAGVCTIGYGTTIYPNRKPVQINDRCSIQQAKAFMQHDLARFEKAVRASVNVAVTQHQFDALVSLTYNIGVGAFKNSTLLKLLNQGDYWGASQQFLVWNKAGGQTVQGLVNRRAIEKDYFLK